MKSSKRPWPLITTFQIRERINTNPDFQRPAVWSISQKQLLVDSIIRDYDVPKLYWRKTGTKPDTYDVVDGQQRLRAIWSFISGDFALPKNSDLVDDEIIANCNYGNLPDEIRMKFDVYSLDVVILEEADEDEVREMFLRLQNGTSLKAQEKRNAYPGIVRDFIHQLTKHVFFSRVMFSDSRFSHDHIAAQLLCIEMAGGPTNVKNKDLNLLYENGNSFDVRSKDAKSVQRVLSILAEIFNERTPELTRYNVIALYCVVSELINNFYFDDCKPLLRDWFISFEELRRQQDQKDDDEVDPEWAIYKEKISHSTDSADSIKHRMDFMLRSFMEVFPNIPRKDNQRSFALSQRMAIFRRDKGLCQVKVKCSGTRVSWDDWHCDHRIAWTKGGHTTVENGQVACTVCNLSKGSG